jgi:hypothetical protein
MSYNNYNRLMKIDPYVVACEWQGTLLICVVVSYFLHTLLLF